MLKFVKTTQILLISIILVLSFIRNFLSAWDTFKAIVAFGILGILEHVSALYRFHALPSTVFNTAQALCFLIFSGMMMQKHEGWEDACKAIDKNKELLSFMEEQTAGKIVEYFCQIYTTYTALLFIYALASLWTAFLSFKVYKTQPKQEDSKV